MLITDGERGATLFLEPLNVAAVTREGPDDGDRGDDDGDPPDRVPGEPRERRDPADDRHDHTDRSRPHRSGEHSEAGEHDDDPDDEVDPPPRRPVELEEILRSLHVERVVENTQPTTAGVARTHTNATPHKQ